VILKPSLNLVLSLAFCLLPAAGANADAAHGGEDSPRIHDTHAAHGAHGTPPGGTEETHGEREPAAAPAREAAHDGPTPDMRIVLKGALERLKEGNRRYAEARMSNPRRGKDQRLLVSKAQLPFAIVVGCADSRVPPEILFDQGLGDLFTVRVAGHVVDDAALGSIEYAVEHLGTRLVMVLGHERCGAVDAACKGGDPGGHVGSLARAIKPAVDVARRNRSAGGHGAKGGRSGADANQGGSLLDAAVRANVERTVDQLKGSWPVLGPEIREERLTVVGGIYDLETGLVEIIP
jgi:carbonic anhydrase